MYHKKLVVIGSINVDHVLNVPNFPTPGETLIGSEYRIAFGGKGGNQAVAAGRCGANVQFIAAVGDDEIGGQINKQLKSDNIDTHLIRTIQNEKTGVALILVNQFGENEIAVYAGANSYLTPKYLQQYYDEILQSDIILIQLEIPIDTIEEVVKLASKNKTKVILNPAPAKKLPDSILKCIDIITPNETETEYLTGIKIANEYDANSAARILHDKGIETVIITLGGKGAWVSQSGIGKLISGFPVKAVDTTGAGDTFNGVLATILLEGSSVEKAVKYANGAAALAVTKNGAQPSIPAREEIENFFRYNNLKKG